MVKVDMDKDFIDNIAIDIYVNALLLEKPGPEKLSPILILYLEKAVEGIMRIVSKAKDHKEDSYE